MKRILDRWKRPTAGNPKLPPGSPDDRQLVLDAASALDLREIELFRLAWWRWYDAPPNPALIERAFAGYMFHGEIPPWVRQFARDVLERARFGSLDPNAFGADRVRRIEPPAKYARLHVAACTAVIAGFLFLMVNPAGDPVNNPATARSIYCQGGPGAASITQIARHFTGRPDPFRCR